MASKRLKNLVKKSPKILIGFALTLLASANVTGHLQSEIVERLDYLIYDLRLKAQVAEPRFDDRIVIVDIDEKSLKEQGRWPWSRDVMADLTMELTDTLGAAAVGYDVVFAEPQRSDALDAVRIIVDAKPKLAEELEQYMDYLRSSFDRDGQFAETLRSRPVVLGYYFTNNQDSVSGALPKALFKDSQLGGLALQSIFWEGYGANLYELQKASDGGYFNPLVDKDGNIRAVPLLSRYGDNYYQSFSLGVLRAALGNPQVIPVFPAGVPDDYGALELLALRSDQLELDIPVERGLLYRVNYRAKGGPDGGGYKYYSAVDILRGDVAPEDIAGRIVLVGTTAPGLLDLRSTPVNPTYPGVEVHANILSSILDGDSKIRPEYAKGVLLISVIVVGAILSMIMPFLGAGWALTVAVAVIGASVGVNSYFYFELNQVYPIAMLLILAFAIFMFDVAYGYLAESRTKRQMVSLFGEYVAPELVTEMADNPAGYSMEGESRYLTVLFSDVRGFTTISESLSPNDLREYINEYLTCMSEIIRGQRGTLDKYIGDAIMAFWGAPIPDDKHAEFAVRAGMAMLEEVPHLNKRLEARGWPALAIGVGINTGQMRVGDMGSKIRKAYTVMGDSVNLGSRLEGITKTYGVGLIVGESTKAEIPEFAFQGLDVVRVKGKDEPVAIYQPMGSFAELSSDKQAMLDLWEALIEQFRGQRWDEALATLDKLDQSPCAQLPLHALYRERIAVFQQDPPPADWDGVTKFDTK